MQPLETARSLTAVAPLPASGRTRERFALLARLAADDLTTARVVEAHLDAVAILAEHGTPPQALDPDSTWGVYAAEAAGLRLDATPAGDGWELTGTKPWCSLAGRLSHALVTAHTGAGRRLFRVALRAPGVEVLEGAWHSRGLVDVPSGPVRFTAAAAEPVGDAGWYLRRPGFAHGGAGVAACWFGGAVGVARALRGGSRAPDQIAHWHRGAVELDLDVARLALDAAAAAIDGGRADGAAGERLAARTRAHVAGAAERVLTAVGHALGPAPLTLDAAHAARVADLTVYLRQHHAERDVAALAASDPDGGPPHDERRDDGRRHDGRRHDEEGWPT